MTRPSAGTDAVTAAASTMDYDSYVLEPDGCPLPQSTAQSLIEDVIRLADVQPGHRVLEIGTGSGYTAALLSRVVGRAGWVVSLDVDAGLVERARRKHVEQQVTGVEVHATDGFASWPAAAPYDRIIGWVTPHILPGAWVAQAADDAMILTPVKVAPIAVATMLLRVRVSGGKPQPLDLHRGGFIEMHHDVITDLGVPIRYVDAVQQTGQDGRPVWISASLLHDNSSGANRAAAMLMDGRTELSPIGRDDAACHAFYSYLLAEHLPELASAGLPGGWGIGLLYPNSAAFLRSRDLYLAGTTHAASQLRALIAVWEQAGRPDHSQLRPVLTEHPEGYTVRPARR